MVAPPRPKGPPLNALRAFEAAARLGGFAAAANELSVTPGAVAQHIKSLEVWLGADLFERKSQGVQISKLGRSVLDDFCDAFDRLGEATDKLRNLAPRTEIRIATLPSIAQLWLSPRMPIIRQAVPDTLVSIIATETAPNLLREPIDLNLFFDDGGEQPNSLVIAPDFIYPVCAPAYAVGIKTVDDLANKLFLHDSSWSEDWSVWLQAQEIAHEIDTRGPSYSLYSLALEEAVNGGGILMGHDVLVRDHIEKAQLVALFERSVPLDRRLTVSSAKRPDESSALFQVVQCLLKSTINR